MSHPFSRRPDWTGLCDELFGFGTGVGLDPGPQARLRAYVRSLAPAARLDASLWSDYAELYGESLADLAGDDPVRAARVEERLYATPLTHGFLQGHMVHESLTSNPAARLHVGRIILDRLVRLSEAVGAGRVQSREHGQTQFVLDGLDALFAAIEDRIGSDLTPPRQAGELFGVQLAKGTFSDRHFDGIYGALRAHRIARDFGIRSPALLEIGGGSGHLAYYARRMGCERFAIIDLPPVLVPQYILLATAFGADVVGFGHRSEPGIALVNAYAGGADRFADWDVVINIDSMPEMAPADAGRYLDRIRPGGLFLSINQESAVQKATTARMSSRTWPATVGSAATPACRPGSAQDGSKKSSRPLDADLRPDPGSRPSTCRRPPIWGIEGSGRRSGVPELPILGTGSHTASG